MLVLITTPLRTVARHTHDANLAEEVLRQQDGQARVIGASEGCHHIWGVDPRRLHWMTPCGCLSHRRVFDTVRGEHCADCGRRYF